MFPGQVLPGDHVKLRSPSVAPGFDSPAAEAALQIALATHMAQNPGKMHMGSHIGAFLHDQLGVMVCRWRLLHAKPFGRLKPLHM